MMEGQDRTFADAWRASHRTEDYPFEPVPGWVKDPLNWITKRVREEYLKDPDGACPHLRRVGLMVTSNGRYRVRKFCPVDGWVAKKDTPRRGHSIKGLPVVKDNRPDPTLPLPPRHDGPAGFLSEYAWKVIIIYDFESISGGEYGDLLRITTDDGLVDTYSKVVSALLDELDPDLPLEVRVWREGRSLSLEWPEVEHEGAQEADAEARMREARRKVGHVPVGE